ncbi:hypothetical protein SAMN05444515_102136 [Ectothiorhodospira marina]|uniref:Uncharacterized protein n=1 Tax=Ectothiorhodospira marina TaxID=1396821 RepID=A0A1H7HDG2_9GAMM|nr:hypothetical protein SAMN05444515_102136 [Ectothiorhodospira marina]
MDAIRVTSGVVDFGYTARVVRERPLQGQGLKGAVPITDGTAPTPIKGVDKRGLSPLRMQVCTGGEVLSAGVHRMDAVAKPTGTYSRRPADNTSPPVHTGRSLQSPPPVNETPQTRPERAEKGSVPILGDAPPVGPAIYR